MFKTDMMGNKRFYVKGNVDDAKRFTIDLTWYHSALAKVASVNDNGDKITLNLIVRDDADEMDEQRLIRMAEQFNLIGFTSF